VSPRDGGQQRHEHQRHGGGHRPPRSTASGDGVRMRDSASVPPNTTRPTTESAALTAIDESGRAWDWVAPSPIVQRARKRFDGPRRRPVLRVNCDRKRAPRQLYVQRQSGTGRKSGAPQPRAIDELRVSAIDTRFSDWAPDDFEPDLAIIHARLRVAPHCFELEVPIVASISMHALARRYQRGFDTSRAAILADVAALAVAPEGNEWQVATSGGRWVGVAAMLKHGARTAMTPVARTFLG
jgi:hypothetical protein